MEYHVPVMLEECLEGLCLRDNGIYVDATFGGGGHSRAILQQLGASGKLFGFDRDADAFRNTWSDPRLKVIRSNYSHIKRFLQLEGVSSVDGVLADLGVSSHQLNQPERGFSFRFDESLDMRMDQDQKVSAYEVIQQYTQERLQEIFSSYGEVRNARTLAARLVEERGLRPIESTGDLREVVAGISYGPENKYLARVFQALRIEVNGELEALKEFLQQATDLLVKGGRLVVMSYHSLEDRLVKNFMRSGVFEGEPERDLYGNFEHYLKPVTRKPIEPSEVEIERNPRARSARLRIAEKL